MTSERAAQERTEDVAPSSDAPAPAPPIQTPMLALAQRMGNASFSRLVGSLDSPGRTVARQPAPTDAPATDAPAPAADAPTAAEIAEAEAWAGEGVKTGTDLTPGAGGAGLNNAPGGFDAQYDPTAAELTIIMRCGVEFIDGIAPDGTIAPAQTRALAQPFADIQALPTEAERQTALAAFRWSPDEDDPEKVRFKTEVETRIEGFWSARHEFFLRKRGWSWLGAKVKVDLQVADKKNLPDCHLTIRPVKVPDTVNLGANVEPGQLTNARDQVMNVSNRTGDSGSFLNHSVRFGINSPAVEGDQVRILDDVVQTFKGAEAARGVADARSIQTPVVLTGHASATGSAEHNQRLSEQRVASVAELMGRQGFVNVTTRVSGTGKGEDEALGGERDEDRRVDIVIGTGAPQNTLEHEFGHAFGLGDEYASTPHVSPGLGRDTGTPQMGDDATHDNLVKAMVDSGGTPLAGAVCEPTDSIMSVGNVVRPQHYATFHASLTEITSQSPWALGPPTAKTAPLPGSAGAPGAGAGDLAPTPGADTAVA